MHAPACGGPPSRSGIRELLVTLGRAPDGRGCAALVALFVAVTLSAALAAEVVPSVLPVPFAAWHAALWLCWLSWHSLLFPRARRHALSRRRDRAYRAVFPTHIVPGVSIGVALMGGAGLHALLNGSSLASPALVAVALAVVCAGSTMLAAGFAAIGFASAGFLFEYVESSEPIVARGIYRYVRHPLFLGGVIASVGAALAFANGAALEGAAVNLIVLPLYRRLEDARLSGVFGESYASYIRDVAAYIPTERPPRLVTRSAIAERSS